MTPAQSTPQPRHLLLGAILLGCVMASNPARAASTNLVPITDTTLFETTPDNNLGASGNFLSGNTANNFKNRALIKFDLSAIPANATITSAALTLTVANAASGPDSTFALHRVLADWSEGVGSGNQGAPANTGETTWSNRFHPSTPWTSSGAAAGSDYTATSSAANVIGASGSFTFGSTTELVADTQTWLTNSGANFGWILVCQNETTIRTARRIGSREDLVNTPVLAVEYTVPAPPPTPPDPPTLFGLAQTGDAVRFSFNAQSNHNYDVEVSTSLNPTNWSVLTNISSQPADTTIHITNQIIPSAERYFRARTQ